MDEDEKEIKEVENSTEDGDAKDEKGPGSSIAIIIILLIALIAGFLYFRRSTDTQETQQPMQTENPQEVSGTQDEVSGRTIEVEAGEYFFTPEEIEVKEGEDLTIVVTNTGKMPHDLVIENTEFKTELIKPGEKSELVIDGLEAGEHVIYCSVGNHRQLGMAASLTVLAK